MIYRMKCYSAIKEMCNRYTQYIWSTYKTVMKEALHYDSQAKVISSEKNQNLRAGTEKEKGHEGNFKDTNVLYQGLVKWIYAL